MSSVVSIVSRRWAPWWVYVGAIAPANLVKEALLPDDSAWWIRAGLTAAILTTGIAVATAVFRGTQRRPARSWDAGRW